MRSRSISGCRLARHGPSAGPLSIADPVPVGIASFGMITLREAGMDAVYSGTTTVEEVVRETIIEA